MGLRLLISQYIIMAFKHFTVNSFILSAGKHCRLDQKYTSFTQINNWEVFDTNYEQVMVSDLLQELPIVKCKKGELEEEALLVNISDQQQRSGELENVETTNDIGSDKNYLGDADIFISKLGMPKGYIFVNTFKGQNLLGSSEFIPYRIRNSGLTKYLKYILLHPKALDAYACLESGKTPSHKRVNPYEFLKIKVPLIPQPIRDQITVQIEPIEQKIKRIKSQIVIPHEIINKVFARYFGINLAEFKVVEQERLFDTNLANIAKQNDLRFSVKHSRYSQYLNEIIQKGNFLSFGTLLTTPPQYGANEPSKEYSEGDVRYIRITDIDDIGNLLDQDVKTADSVDDRYMLRDNDFLFARSGNTVGKSFLFDSDKHPKSIFAGYFIKFNFDTNQLLPLFLLYYSKSFFFEIWKNTVIRLMGQPNINAEEYKTLVIPDMPLEAQQKIVDEIKQELDKQEEIKHEILNERGKIDKIIEKNMRK